MPRVAHTNKAPGFEGESEPPLLPPSKIGPKPAADWRSARSTRTTAQTRKYHRGYCSAYPPLPQGNQGIQRPNGQRTLEAYYFNLIIYREETPRPYSQCCTVQHTRTKKMTSSGWFKLLKKRTCGRKILDPLGRGEEAKTEQYPRWYLLVEHSSPSQKATLTLLL